MLVLDPSERASIQELVDSPACLYFLNRHPQVDNRVLYCEGKYELVSEASDCLFAKVRRMSDMMLFYMAAYNEEEEAKRAAEKLRETQSG